MIWSTVIHTTTTATRPTPASINMSTRRAIRSRVLFERVANIMRLIVRVNLWYLNNYNRLVHKLF